MPFAWRLQSAVRKAQSIDEVLKQADFVTLHVPLVAATRGLINAKRLAVMKPGAVLLNFARDAIVDEAAVIEALRADRLKAYLTDFPSPALSAFHEVIRCTGFAAWTEAERTARGDGRRATA